MSEKLLEIVPKICADVRGISDRHYVRNSEDIIISEACPNFCEDTCLESCKNTCEVLREVKRPNQRQKGMQGQMSVIMSDKMSGWLSRIIALDFQNFCQTRCPMPRKCQSEAQNYVRYSAQLTVRVTVNNYVICHINVMHLIIVHAENTCQKKCQNTCQMYKSSGQNISDKMSENMLVFT